MTQTSEIRAYKAGLMQGKAYRVLNAHLTKALLHYDLAIPEWKLLGQLAEYGDMKLAKLADHLSVEAPLVTALVDRLEKKGFVKRTNDIQDKRAKVISATNKGLKLIEEIEPHVKDAMRVLLKGVPHDDILAYLRVLEAIVKNG